METKLWNSEWEIVKKRVKMPNALIVDATRRKGGLGLLWPCDLNVEIKSFSTHHIEACIKDGAAEPWSSQSGGNMFLPGQLHTNQFEPRIAQLLDTDFVKEDVKKCLFTMVGSKSPGPDGMPAKFFQHY
ncbi:hypothetical protein LIER_38090 [Lithospermum erythrorhizon]|uniref:Reverse transcriptase n=1 Tax=Lithospermum erythrorhizon TaxID=34254 RepID=A0AAV3PUI5_LITER